jgi:hypothetical protein
MTSTNAATARPRSVPEALNELHTAAAELLEPITRKVLRDGGTTTSHTAPSRLNQLRAAIGTSGESGGGGRGSGIPIPIDPSATDLLSEITTGAVDMHDRALEQSRPTIEDHIRSTVALVERWDEPSMIAWATGWLRFWQRAIDNQFNPQPRYHLDTPCPACGARMAFRFDTTIGENVQVPALIVDSRTGADCRACGAHWSPEQFEELGQFIRGAADRPRPVASAPRAQGSVATRSTGDTR